MINQRQRQRGKQIQVGNGKKEISRLLCYHVETCKLISGSTQENCNALSWRITAHSRGNS
jgi:hypothetical protein